MDQQQAPQPPAQMPPQQQPQWTPPPQQPTGWGGPSYGAPPPRPTGVTLAGIFLIVMGVLYALGGAASGMTFADSELEGVVGARVDGLLLTCVGVPEYPSATGGAPGEPTRVRSVTPRSS